MPVAINNFAFFDGERRPVACLRFIAIPIENIVRSAAQGNGTVPDLFSIWTGNKSLPISNGAQINSDSIGKLTLC